MPRLALGALATLLSLAALSPSASAQDRSELRRLVLTSGDIFVGTVVDETADPVVIVTEDGVRREFPRDRIELIAPLIQGRFFRTDPVRTRFFLAPTARTIGAGEFRGDLTYIFPSVTVGLSDRVDLLGSGLIGVSSGAGDEVFFTPLVGLKGQVYASERAQVALGLSAQAALGGGEGAFSAIPYAVVTLGDEIRGVSFGIGGAVGGIGGDVEVANSVIVGLGGEVQVNNGVKLFVESLTAVGGDDEGVLVLPGVRFFGNQFAFDLIGFVATDFESLVGFAPIGARVSYTF